MAHSVSRRQFLGAAAAGAALAATEDNNKPMPTRTLGKTGVKVSILALGGGSRLLSYEKEEAAVEAINLALDLGITYLDTAISYGNGKSETWVGQVLKTRRKGIFVATKIGNRDPNEAQRMLEASLKRLQTDQIDLIHVHSLRDEADLAKVEAKGGVLDVLRKLRDQKVCRFIGITSHYDPTALKTAIERHDIDCTQMALNAALQGYTSGQTGMVPNPAIQTSFELIALPAARKKNLGILAMKTLGHDHLLGAGPGKGEPSKLLRYALSVPGVCVAVVGMPKMEFIRQNIAVAKAFKPLPKGEMKELSERMAGANKVALDRHFADHVDG